MTAKIEPFSESGAIAPFFHYDENEQNDDIISLDQSLEQVEEGLQELEKMEDDVYRSKYPAWLILTVVLLTGTAMNANFSVLSIALYKRFDLKRQTFTLETTFSSLSYRPLLREEFHSTDQIVSWITIGPMLASTVITPVASKLADDCTLSSLISKGSLPYLHLIYLFLT